MREDRLAEARRALNRGDVLIAYDEARSVLESAPNDLDAAFMAALALARAGSTEHARAALEDLHTRASAAPDASDRLREDVESLGARIAKDRALKSPEPDRRRLALEAADLYEAVTRRYGGFFPCVNAATLRLLGGDEDGARDLANQTRALLANESTDHDDYWRVATAAEAALILGDVATASLALEHAAQASRNDPAAMAVTRKQLRLICAELEIDDSVLDVLMPPNVLHYCGHRIDSDDGPSRFPPTREHEITARISGYLDGQRIGFAYGSLASGADILIAEACLEREIELNVVLPFAVDEFSRESVRTAGNGWLARFHACLRRASTIVIASDSAFMGESALFGYAARIAMGHALNRAAFLSVDATQLAIWDGVDDDGPAGTAHDVAVWRRSGHGTEVVRLTRAEPASNGTRESGDGHENDNRRIRAALFGDFRGFSRLRDEHFPPFIREVLGAIRSVLDRYDDCIVYRNTWGDAIVVVLNDVGAAAACALDIQAIMHDFDLAGIGLPPDLGLRVGGHVGPVIELVDPIRDEVVAWGRELTRAARIEPHTPEGDVYVSDAFAALLALDVHTAIAAEYVGRVTTAKQFETIPMYRLRRAT